MRICSLIAMLALVGQTNEAEAYACDNRHYVNSSGRIIHSASCGREHLHQTAIYRDGSVSFSEHHRGTCPHRRDVAQWE
jgi:Protein of unknown function (DUF3761)